MVRKHFRQRGSGKAILEVKEGYTFKEFILVF